MRRTHDVPADGSNQDDESNSGGHRLSRRSFVTAGSLLAVGLAGCSSTDEPAATPDAIAISAGQMCDECGMVIRNHPGPNGEIFYDENAPDGHDNPARFDSLRGCLFPYLFEHERSDWDALVVYVTDYSRVDYSLSTEMGDTYISSHAAADSFVAASDATFVVGSDVYGAMGRDFVPFSERTDAESFANERGGKLVSFDSIDPAMLAR